MVIKPYEKNLRLMNQRLPFFGNYRYVFDGSEGERVFEFLLSKGTVFSIINHGVPYFADFPGRKKLKKARREVLDLGLIGSSVICAAWITDWPGTSLANPPRLIVFLKLKEVSRKLLLKESPSVFWKGFHNWEDLIVYQNRNILFWECFHEKMACVYGSEKFFGSLGLAGTPFNLDEEDNLLCGVELPQPILNELFL